MELKDIRRQFPALARPVEGKRLIYFDNACSVLKPRPVIAAVTRYLSDLGACAGGRSGHVLSGLTEQLCHEARFKTAAFLNAESPSEIIFTGNATEGLNLAAKCFPFTGARNEVVVTAFEHHSNLLPFLEERKNGVRVRVALPEKDWTLSAEKICSLITDRTALVSVPLCSNVTGQVFPVREIAAAAHRRGAAVLADGAQYLSTSAADVRRDGIDMLAFSGHKLGAPPGIGVLYCRRGLMKKLGNFKVGGGTVSDVLWDGSGLPRPVYFGDFRRFEAGIQNYAGIAGLGAALDFLSDLGLDNIRARTGRLAAWCRERLAGIDGVELLGPGGTAAPAGPIVSFAFRNKKIHAQDFNIFLNNELPRHVVCVRCGSHCAIPLHRLRGLAQSLRLSFFIYNTGAEAEIFIGALESYLRAAGK